MVWVLHFKKDVNWLVRSQERDRWEVHKQDQQRVSRISIKINDWGKASEQSLSCVWGGWSKVVFQTKEKKAIYPTHKTSQHLLNPSGVSSTSRDTEVLPAESVKVPMSLEGSPATHTSSALHPHFSTFTRCGYRIELHPLKGENKEDDVVPWHPVCIFPNIIKKSWTNFNNMVKCRSGECLKEMLLYNSTWLTQIELH